MLADPSVCGLHSDGAAKRSWNSNRSTSVSAKSRGTQPSGNSNSGSTSWMPRPRVRNGVNKVAVQRRSSKIAFAGQGGAKAHLSTKTQIQLTVIVFQRPASTSR